MERALRVINFRNENDKLNVWTSYMNLEHNFGTEQTLVEIFKRALESCKPKSVYFKLLEIYKNSNKLNLMLQISKNMVAKFKRSSKAWSQHL